MPIIYSRYDSCDTCYACYCFRYMYLLWFLSWYLLGYDSSDDSCFSLCHDSCHAFPFWLAYDLHLWFYTFGYSVAWDKGIYMRVSLFGLFLRCTSLMGPWPKRIKSLLLIISFTPDFLFYGHYVILLHTCFICVLTLLSSEFDTCAPPGSPLGFVSYSPGEFHWLPWILMSRLWSPERVDSPRYCSEWRSGSVDLQPTVQSHILPGPLYASRVSS